MRLVKGLSVCDLNNEAVVEGPTRCLFGQAPPGDRAVRLGNKRGRTILVRISSRSTLDRNRSLRRIFSVISSCILQMTIRIYQFCMGHDA